MDAKIRSFLKKVVLTPFVVSVEIREEALNLLLSEATVSTEGPNVLLYLNGSYLHYGIDRETYNHISNELKDGRKIVGIKLLRVYYQGKTGMLLPLIDAKNTCDNWTFGL